MYNPNLTNMKTIRIKKNYEFSPNSKVLLHIGDKQVHIKGFESFSFTVDPGQEFFVSQQWTRSNKISYSQISDTSSFIIKPRLGKMLAFISLLIFAICTVIFVFTKYRWSFLPLTPVAFYVLLYLTILREKYLIIKPINEEQNSNSK
jgi:hypothetical protein